MNDDELRQHNEQCFEVSQGPLRGFIDYTEQFAAFLYAVLLIQKDSETWDQLVSYLQKECPNGYLSFRNYTICAVKRCTAEVYIAGHPELEDNMQMQNLILGDIEHHEVKVFVCTEKYLSVRTMPISVYEAASHSDA
ncbi:MAG: hypothetical protein LR017_00485 [Candidatus Pacebacteria bacterium]|nr:hypothetical protein [Candidatus Paceibacterota bacterium]